MFRIYRTAARCWWTLLPLLMVVSAAIECRRFVPAGPALGYAIFIGMLGATGLLSWFIHRFCLYGETPFSIWKNGGRAPKRPLARFILIYMALNLAAFIPATLVPALPFDLVYAALYFVIFSLFAAELPDAIDADPRYTTAQALRQAPRMAWLLLAGTGLATLAFQQMETHSMRAVLPLSVDMPVLIAINTVKGTIGLFPTILAVAASCHIYRRIAPQTSSATANRTALG